MVKFVLRKLPGPEHKYHIPSKSDHKETNETRETNQSDQSTEFWVRGWYAILRGEELHMEFSLNPRT